MIPDNVEKIIMTKEDYDRNVEQLLLEKINAEQEIERLKEELKYTIPIVEHNKTITKHLKEIERLNNIIKEVREYIELGMNFDSLGVARTKKKLLQILNKVGDEK